MLKVLYAHCQAIYGTLQEQRDVKLLEALGFEVVNPSDSKHAEGYKHAGMDYSLTLIQEVDVVAFRALPDGSIPAGIAKELAWARGEGLDRAEVKLIIELPSLPPLRKVLSVSATRQYLHEIGQR